MIESWFDTSANYTTSAVTQYKHNNMFLMKHHSDIYAFFISLQTAKDNHLYMKITCLSTIYSKVHSKVCVLNAFCDLLQTLKAKITDLCT